MGDGYWFIDSVCVSIKHLAETVYKGVAIGIVPKDLFELDSTGDDIKGRPEGVRRSTSYENGASSGQMAVTLVMFHFDMLGAWNPRASSSLEAKILNLHEIP